MAKYCKNCRKWVQGELGRWNWEQTVVGAIGATLAARSPQNTTAATVGTLVGRALGALLRSAFAKPHCELCGSPLPALALASPQELLGNLPRPAPSARAHHIGIAPPEGP